MSAVRAGSGWARVDAALDELLALAVSDRPAAIARIAGADAAFAQELASLAAHLDGDDTLLDKPAVDALQRSATLAATLSPGTRLGPWCIDELLGRGGMGEVYRAHRADGQFEQQVAIKLMRVDAMLQGGRFLAERQIVARLDHPGIARLLDGEVAADGRPYMVMELVDGLDIVEWCAAHRPSLERRLALFIEVCDAVAYAHRNLIVHRDLKPANVLVTAEGRVKLLDFGIARLLDAPSGQTTGELLLTPSYAAPEVLMGAPITTAADVHSLGLLLYELLCGQPAHPVRHLPLGAQMQAVITQDAPPPSRVAATLAAPPVAAQRLAGDLDAIVAKALRKEPEQRYASVDEMRADVERHLRQEPVVARRGSRVYVVGRALRRHRAWAVGTSLALLAVLIGATATVWQARQARSEAERATAVKNFLVQVFMASDPRIPADKPRGQVTARELLDVSAERIEHDFRTRPDLEVELLSVVGGVYSRLREKERYDATIALRRRIAAEHPGRYPRVEIEALGDRIDDVLETPNPQAANPLLAQLDGMIRDAGLDDTSLRAAWWQQKARAEPRPDLDAQQRDFERAADLYRRVAPHDPGYVQVLAEMANVASNGRRYEDALRLSHAAIDAAATTDERMDGDMLTVWGNIGTVNVMLGRYDDAVAAYEQAEALTERTYGKTHREYLRLASAHASLLHVNGDRDESMRRFEALLRLVPDPPVREQEWSVVSEHAIRLAAQGEPERAIATLEGYERFVAANSSMPPFALRRARSFLGNAYGLAGRRDDARRILRLALDEYRAQEPPGSASRMIATERWARVLVEDGHVEEGRTLFNEVLAADDDRQLAVTALAQLGLSRVELALGHPDAAVRESRKALDRWHRVKGYRDVRVGTMILREHARALLAAGDAAGAKEAALQALAESLRFDAPTSATIADARALVQRAEAAH